MVTIIPVKVTKERVLKYEWIHWRMNRRNTRGDIMRN
jgi:hypothetical protein